MSSYAEGDLGMTKNYRHKWIMACHGNDKVYRHVTTKQFLTSEIKGTGNRREEADVACEIMTLSC